MPCMEGGETHVRMLHIATNSVGLRPCLPTDQTYDELTLGPCLRMSVPSPGPCHRVNVACADVALPCPSGPFFGSAALPYRHGPCLGLPYHHIGAGLLDLELNSQHPLELRPALLLGIIASQTSTTSPSPWCVHRALWPASSCQLLLCCVASIPWRP